MSRPTLCVLVAIALLVSAVGVVGCAGSQTSDEPSKPKAAPGFPEGYATWKKVNEATIIRAEEKIAREVYAQKIGDLGPGSVLVKEQYSYAGGVKGELQLIAVMRRGSDSSTDGGWSFAGYDPQTRQAKGEIVACKGCHSLQEDNDFLFSDRSAF